MKNYFFILSCLLFQTNIFAQDTISSISKFELAIGVLASVPFQANQNEVSVDGSKGFSYNFEVQNKVTIGYALKAGYIIRVAKSFELIPQINYARTTFYTEKIGTDNCSICNLPVNYYGYINKRINYNLIGIMLTSRINFKKIFFDNGLGFNYNAKQLTTINSKDIVMNIKNENKYTNKSIFYLLSSEHHLSYELIKNKLYNSLGITMYYQEDFLKRINLSLSLRFKI
jgi:hypothetical protein